jgi:lysophospholipase L1-like esterase
LARAWLYWLAPREAYPLYALASEFPEAAKYAPHHYMAYRLQPGYRRGGASHNSLGYRGPEISRDKPPGVYRIAVLGGSTTYGEFIDADRDAFPAQLQDCLRRKGFESVEAINAGVPGYNSWESLVDLEFRVLDLEPDLVVVYYGVNDVHCRLVAPETYQSDNSGRRRVWSEPLDVRLLRYSLVSRIVGFHLGLWQSPGVDSYVKARGERLADDGRSSAGRTSAMERLDRNGSEYFERNLRSTIAVSRAAGAEVMLATWAHSPEIGDYAATPQYQRGIRELNQSILKVAGETASACYDFAPEMPSDVRYWRDGRHVNAAGAALQGERFAQFIAAHAEEFGLRTSRDERYDRRQDAAADARR